MMDAAASDEVRFERIREEHLHEVMAIEVEAYPEPWTVGMFHDEIGNPKSYFIVMDMGGALAGYGGFWLVLDEAHITSVTVRNTFRGRGLGRILTQRLLDVARQSGARMATLEVRASNTVARNLYVSFGFRAVGVRKGYYSRSGEDAVVMLKELDESGREQTTKAEEGGFSANA